MIEKIKHSIKKHGVISSVMAFLDKTATYKAVAILAIVIIYLFIRG
jgi:hypothetical protein|tara:strand:+ start:68 stop:205 length:138 start_codon:yes stop_codon:yes gene_type:complete